MDRLIDVLVRLRALQWPATESFGRTFYNVGLIEGGVAPNVIAPHASAELLFRTVGPPDDILRVLDAVSSEVSIEEILRVRW